MILFYFSRLKLIKYVAISYGGGVGVGDGALTGGRGWGSGIGVLMGRRSPVPVPVVGPSALRQHSRRVQF